MRFPNFTWNEDGLGTFGDPTNWNDGDDGVPGAGDVAIFDLPATYTVWFQASHTTERALIRSGIVTFDFDPSFSFSVDGASILLPGVLIGAETGDVATLRIEGDGQGNGLLGVYADVGAAPGTVGSIVLDNASLDVDQQLRVGALGTGGLDAENATIASGTSQVGRSTGSFGSATIGTGSTWTIDGGFTVADGGVGMLEITDGGAVFADSGIIAQRTASQGMVEVDGPGSLWDMGDSLDVGMRSNGALDITGGGEVICRGFSTIGTFPAVPPNEGGPGGSGGFGEVVVSGTGSMLTVAADIAAGDGDLFVGYFTGGILDVRNDAWVTVEGDLTAEDNSISGGLIPLVFGLEDAADWCCDAAVMVTGDAVIEAMLVEIGDGYVPVAGNTHKLLAATSGLDTISGQTVEPLPPPFLWRIDREASLYELTVQECTEDPDRDCNRNGINDVCEILDKTAADIDGDGVPDECLPCPGDITGTGFVGFEDLVTLLNAWGPCVGECIADIDGGGSVGFSDLQILLQNWGPCV